MPATSAGVYPTHPIRVAPFPYKNIYWCGKRLLVRICLEIGLFIATINENASVIIELWFDMHACMSWSFNFLGNLIEALTGLWIKRRKIHQLFHFLLYQVLFSFMCENPAKFFQGFLFFLASVRDVLFYFLKFLKS